MKPIEPTPREKAAAGNGDWFEYLEYEADVNRKPDWQGIGDPDPKYDLAPLLIEGFCELAFTRDMERLFDDSKKNKCTDDTADLENGTDLTP